MRNEDLNVLEIYRDAYFELVIELIIMMSKFPMRMILYFEAI